MKYIKVFFFNTVTAYILLELVSIIFISSTSIIPQPQAWKRSIENPHPKNVDSDSLFGVWHVTNSHFHHVKDCFDVFNHINSYGARDIERPRESDKQRIFLAGDSFIEGFGIDTSQRMSNLLEKDLNCEIMNFGTSGNFGSTQMRLLYEKYGKQFRHDLVVIGLTPSNDFLEDDIIFGKDYFHNRYRPYLVKTKDSFELQYYLNDISDSAWHPLNINQKIKDNEHSTVVEKLKSKLSKVSFFYQILAYVKNRYFLDIPFTSLKFSNYSSNELDILLHNIKLIQSAAIANNAKILIFTIPAKEDILALANKTHKNNLALSIRSFCDENRISYVDLLFEQSQLDNINGLFLECDGHWSSYGNENAKDILKPVIDSILNIGRQDQNSSKR